MNLPKVTDKKLIDILNMLPDDYKLWWYWNKQTYEVRELKQWPMIFNDHHAIYSTTLEKGYFNISAHLITTVFRGEV